MIPTREQVIEKWVEIVNSKKYGHYGLNIHSDLFNDLLNIAWQIAQDEKEKEILDELEKVYIEKSRIWQIGQETEDSNMEYVDVIDSVFFKDVILKELRKRNNSQHEVKKDDKTLSNLSSGDTKHGDKKLQLERSATECGQPSSADTKIRKRKEVRHDVL